jgi:LEA14-like dessication related protein
MNLNKYIFSGFLFLFMACSSPKPFIFKGIESIKMEKASFGKNILKADFVYENPNNFNLVLKNLDCSVFINDELFTQYKSDTVYKIPAKANFVLPAKMQVELGLLLKNSVDILFNKPMKISVKGMATITKGMLTKIIPISYETTQQLNLKEALQR